jgi:hypothetical protein
VPVADLLQLYGEHFFSVLHQSYPQFMNQPNLFNFLKSIDNYVHPEVLKLYPEAELPTFSAEMNNENEMNLTYNSSRKMSDFAIGLIKGAGLFFKENIIVEKSKEENEGEKVVIKIKKVE